MAGLEIPDQLGAWLLSSRRRRLFSSIGLGLPLLLSVARSVPPVEDWRWLNPTLVGLQALTIAVLVILLPHPAVDKMQSPRATVAAEQFSHWWRLLWFFWLAQYLMMFSRELYVAVLPNHLPKWVEALGRSVLNPVSNLTTIAILISYYILTTKTVRVTEEAIEPMRLPWDKAVAVALLLAVAEVAVRLNEAISPRLIQGFPHNFAVMFDWITGIAAGLVIALFVGRIDSRYIGLPSPVIAALFVYSVIQTAWASLDNGPLTRIVVVNLALALKLLLYCVVYWMFKSGMLLYYLERAAGVHERAPAERREFLKRVQRKLNAA